MGWAQTGPPNPDSVHHSPYHAIYNHLYYLQEDLNRSPQRAARSLARAGVAQAELEKRAVQLKAIYDGAGKYIYLEDLPRNPDYLNADSQAQYTPFLDLSGVYLERLDGKWVYSRSTVANIPTIFKKVYPFPLSAIVERELPDSFQRQVLGLALWQYLGLVLVVLLAWLLHKVVARAFRGIIDGFFRRYLSEKLPINMLLRLARPFSHIVLVTLIRIALPALELPVQVNHFFMLGLNVAIPLLWVLALYRLVDIVAYVLGHLAERTENSLDDQLVPLFRRIGKFVVVVFGIVWMLRHFNYDVTTLLAGLSIGGLALALAAQDTLKNFFGSIMIIVDKPFQVGDWINYQGIDGTVEEVGLRSTRVRTFYDSQVYIPNGQLADNVIDNYGRRTYRRWKTTVGVMYHTPPDLIEAFVQGMRELILAHPYTRKDWYVVELNGFGASSLDIQLIVFWDVPGYFDETHCRHELMLGIIRLAQELGVGFAFPSTSLYIEATPDHPLKGDFPLREEEAKAAAMRLGKGHQSRWKGPIQGGPTPNPS